MDDEFGVDTDVLDALVAADPGPSRPTSQKQQQQPQGGSSRLAQQPIPQRIQQPKPQRLDRPPPPRANPSPLSSSGSGPKVVQPTPQALPPRSSGSSILVSPRQKGNPVLACLRSMPWEYSDIPADYVLGTTTCALFLSLKYHRLHPEYIYTRIRNLQGRYTLRVLLTMVDIPSHEDALRELSKTSLVNGVTVMLCWSAAEAARYLELYKSYEHTGPAAIRGQQATGYAERLVEFVTVPRSINKADAVALVSTFGSLRNAVNATPDQVSVVSGWGERKVKSWCRAVEEPFRVGKRGGVAAGRRSTANAAKRATTANRGPAGEKNNEPRSSAVAGTGDAPDGAAGDRSADDNDYDDDEAVMSTVAPGGGENGKAPLSQQQPKTLSGASGEGQLSEGVAAALARLRETG